MTDIHALARTIAESMTEAQRIDLIAQLYELYIRAIQPIDHAKQQCSLVPDWMHLQCRNITHSQIAHIRNNISSRYKKSNVQ